MGGAMARLKGIEVIIQEDYVLMPRPWVERLFSWPWRPWQSEDLIETQLLKRGETLEIDGRLLVQRSNYNEMLKLLEKQKADQL